MVAGFQVPVNPLVEVAGSVGAVVPEQKAGMGSNVGVYTGFTRVILAAGVLEQPLIPRLKLLYVPAFKPVTVMVPVALACTLVGPTCTPSSLYPNE